MPASATSCRIVGSMNPAAARSAQTRSISPASATAPRLLLARAASHNQQARTGGIRRRPNPWGRRASVAIFTAG